MGLSTKAIRRAIMVCLVAVSCLWPHFSPADEPGAGRVSDRVEEGDLATVDYSAFTEDGKLVYTTRAEDAADGAFPKGATYRGQAVFFPEEATAGKAARFPGVGGSLVGMAVGEGKKITLPAEKAFGPSNPQLIKTFPTVKTLNKTIRFSASDYVSQFGAFPSEGKEVSLSPYLKTRVSRVAETYAELDVAAGDTDHFTEEYGTVEVRRQGDEFKVVLSPKIGAAFRTADQVGKVVASSADSFTVDFNHPLAGKPVLLNIRVLKVVRASELAQIQIPWIEDHDKGLTSARDAGKPAVLLLYADWCQWCKKLLTESFPDPRVKELKDRLVWIKVNSDLLKEYGTKYGQKGFPTIVLFRPDGAIARKIEGYLNAAALRDALGTLIEGRTARVF